MMDIKKVLNQTFQLGETHWQQADSESFRDNKRADQTMKKFVDLRDATVTEISDEIKRLRVQTQELTCLAADEVERLRAFCRAIMREWPNGEPDGGEIQDAAVECGLLTPRTVTEPCGEYCQCAEFCAPDEFAEGVTCYKKVEWLTKAETRAFIVPEALDKLAIFEDHANG